MLFRFVSNENATIDFVLIWAASAQTATQHAASLVQCHRQLIENHLVPQSLSMKTNFPSNAGVGAVVCGVEIGNKSYGFFLTHAVRPKAMQRLMIDQRWSILDDCGLMIKISWLMLCTEFIHQQSSLINHQACIINHQLCPSIINHQSSLHPKIINFVVRKLVFWGCKGGLGAS